MTTIYSGDLDRLADEGWEIGSSEGCAIWVRHDEHPEWVSLNLSPCGDMSLEDDEVEDGYIGPSGQTNTITEALLGLLQEGR